MCVYVYAFVAGSGGPGAEEGSSSLTVTPSTTHCTALSVHCWDHATTTHTLAGTVVHTPISIAMTVCRPEPGLCHVTEAINDNAMTPHCNYIMMQ